MKLHNIDHALFHDVSTAREGRTAREIAIERQLPVEEVRSRLARMAAAGWGIEPVDGGSPGAAIGPDTRLRFAALVLTNEDRVSLRAADLLTHLTVRAQEVAARLCERPGPLVREDLRRRAGSHHEDALAVHDHVLAALRGDGDPREHVRLALALVERMKRTEEPLDAWMRARLPALPRARFLKDVFEAHERRRALILLIQGLAGKEAVAA